MCYPSTAEYVVLNKWWVVFILYIYVLSFSVFTWKISFILHWLVNLWERKDTSFFFLQETLLIYYCFLLHFDISRLLVSLNKTIYKLLFQLWNLFVKYREKHCCFIWSWGRGVAPGSLSTLLPFSIPDCSLLSWGFSPKVDFTQAENHWFTKHMTNLTWQWPTNTINSSFLW